MLQKASAKCKIELLKEDVAKGKDEVGLFSFGFIVENLILSHKGGYWRAECAAITNRIVNPNYINVTFDDEP